MHNYLSKFTKQKCIIIIPNTLQSPLTTYTTVPICIVVHSPHRIVHIDYTCLPVLANSNSPPPLTYHHHTQSEDNRHNKG